MKTIILVHPSMSLKMTFSIIKSKGYKIFSIITSFESSKIDSTFIQNSSDYVFQGNKNVIEDYEEINSIISKNRLTICGIINGIDSTIYYADFLTKKYIDKNIDLNYSQTRTNKSAVNSCLTKNNIASILGFEMVSIDDTDHVKRKLSSLKFPIVGKPTENTAAMSAFRVLHTMSDVDSYILEFFKKKNPYYHDNTIDKIVFQECIDRLTNREFVLDFVSYDGKHYCRGIIHYDKEVISEHFPISRFYRTASLSKNPELLLLVNYVRSCLDALKVRHGLTHNEVFFDGDSKTLLVETNNRVAGGGLLELINSAYGCNPIDDYLKLVSHDELTDIDIKNNSVALDIYNHFSNNAEDINLSGLRSKVEVLHFRNKKKNTANYFENYSRVDSVNACLLLSNSSSHDLEEDCKKVIHREKKGTLFI